MLCYRDMTFCHYYKGCQKGDECPRSYTDDVKKDVLEWWGQEGGPVCFFCEIPHCFVQFKSKNIK